MAAPEPVFADEFDAPALDQRKWLAQYLPHWSQRAHRAALRDRRELPNTAHRTRTSPPLVSGVRWRREGLEPADRTFSGPLGSRLGQHRYADHLVVREEQPACRLFLMQRGRIELRARAHIDANNLIALWLIGFEDQPEHCGELCVMEIKSWERRDDGTTLLGYGIKPWADPALRRDFHEDRLALDVGEFHTYAAEWRADRIEFFLDGRRLRSIEISRRATRCS